MDRCNCENNACEHEPAGCGMPPGEDTRVMYVGRVCQGCYDKMPEQFRLVRGFTLDQRTEMSNAFDAGNCASAYETDDIAECDIAEMPDHERAAFVLGFFGSLALDEIGSDREVFDEAYYSPAGRYVVEVAKYTDDRSDEYKAEEEPDDELEADRSPDSDPSEEG